MESTVMDCWTAFAPPYLHATFFPPRSHGSCVAIKRLSIEPLSGCPGVVWIWDLGRMALKSLLKHQSTVKCMAWDPAARGELSRLALSPGDPVWGLKTQIFPTPCGQLRAMKHLFLTDRVAYFPRTIRCRRPCGPERIAVGRGVAEAPQIRCSSFGHLGRLRHCLARCRRPGCAGERMGAATRPEG